MAITICQKNRYKGVKTWYAKVPTDGGYRYFSLKTSNKSLAAQFLQDNIKKGLYDQKVQKADTITYAEALRKFYVFEEMKGVKPASIETFRVALECVSGLSDRKVCEVTGDEIQEAFLTVNGDKSNATYRHRRIVLGMFYRFCVDRLEILQKSPLDRAVPKKRADRTVHHFWTQEQIDRILDQAPGARYRIFWALMAFAGLRISEAKAVRPSSFSDGKLYVKGKGDKESILPVSPRLQREIDRYNGVGGTWELPKNDMYIKDAARRALPEGFQGKAHAHRFRHSFGSNLIRGHANIKVVQTLMRHENIQTTLDLYCHILDEDVKKAVDDIFK